MTETLIALDGVWQAFRPRTSHGTRRRGAGPAWALRDVSFRVERGETIGLVGRNGSGKTTLLRTLAGVLEPSRGTCAIAGRVSSLLDLTAGLNRDLSGTENIMLGGVLLGLSRREVRQEYAAIRDFSGLEASVLDQPLSAYSAGMTLRVAFSVVTRSHPSVLVVDEVLAVGDEAFQQRALGWMDGFAKQGAVVIASHDPELVRGLCDRVLVFDAGVLVFDGPPEEALAFYTELAVPDAPDATAAAPQWPPRAIRWWERALVSPGLRRTRQ